MKAVYIGADHAGFNLKEHLKTFLAKIGYHVHDTGARIFNKNDDYPDFAFSVANNVSHSKSAFGILVCGSSQGVCIAANKINNIRAVSVNNIKDARLTREHNGANVLCLSGWNTKPKDAEKIALAFLKTPFSELARHKRRLKKITLLERR